ncbi:TPA: hypothetical protein RSW73_000245 [Vibrio cholerae]|nr:hypothetical protein [Vibrio cholerae]
MSDNDYYKRTKEFDPRTRANGLDVEFELDAISAAFDKIPAPREDGQGYDGPIHVGAATAPTHAVQLQQMEAKLGDNTENANRAEEAAERAEEARDIAIEKARQSGEARDEALEAAATVTNIHREQLEKALGVNARVYPRLTNQNLKVGDVIPAPEDTADGLPITHVIVDGNVYAMSPIAHGLVADLATTSVTIGGVFIKFGAPISSERVGFRGRDLSSKLDEFLSAKDFGAAGDGVRDDTASIELAQSGFYHLTPGNYLYKGSSTPDYSKITFSNGADIVGMTNSTSITARDSSGEVFGIQHNYNEEKRNASGVTPKITTGAFDSPPLSDNNPNNEVDILAHWYNDFGLEAVRSANGGIGWVGWYTWEWNHTDSATGYDPKRHPMLGWYRGDDATVLDWQCYWLREHGVKGVVLQATSLDTTTWSNPEDEGRGYWLYQLFKHTPNFNGLAYVLGGVSEAVNQSEFESRWSGYVNNILSVHGNFYITAINNKKYPTIYLHDVATVRAGIYGGNDTAFEAWLKSMSDFFKSAGYDGVCVLGRNATYYTTAANAARYQARLSGIGVVMLETDYGNFSGTYSAPTTYADFVNNFGAAYDAVKFRHIPNVMTSRFSKDHPSAWTTDGSTPKLFADVLLKASNAAQKNETIPSIVTIYNVAEWAEGGASLQPNVSDLFGYLEACKKVNNWNQQKSVKNELRTVKQISGATTNISSDFPLVKLYTTFGVTLNTATFKPTIEAGVDGQEITLINTADAGGAHSIVLCDESNSAGSGLFLTSATYAMNNWDSIKLVYLSGKGWVETARSNVIPV